MPSHPLRSSLPVHAAVTCLSTCIGPMAAALCASNGPGSGPLGLSTACAPTQPSKLAPINFLYGHLHNSIRTELDALAAEVAGLKAAGEGALVHHLQHLKERYHFLEQVYKYHSSVEDEVGCAGCVQGGCPRVPQLMHGCGCLAAGGVPSAGRQGAQCHPGLQRGTPGRGETPTATATAAAAALCLPYNHGSMGCVIGLHLHPRPASCTTWMSSFVLARQMFIWYRVAWKQGEGTSHANTSASLLCP